jgi:acyl carrier protein
MEQRILEIVSQIMEVPLESLTLASSAETIPGWDSLKHMNLVLALEETFGILFSEDQIPELTQVGTILTIVGKLATT